MSFTKEQLRPGESLVITGRQHPLVLFRPILFNIAALVVLISIPYLLGDSGYSEKVWPILALYIIPFIYLMWEILAWRKREYILTDRRVVKQEGVFSVSSFDAPLDKINNLFHQQSFMGRLLKYGEVGLETASEQGTTVLSFLSHPLDFKNAIVHQREMYNAGSRSSGQPSQPTVPQLIQELASLRDQNIITESEFQQKKKALLEKL
jgi:uncharacterized membrane protein YdbT with pleckstrin-like domain